MKAKYQKYYDALKGVDLSGSLTSLSSAVSKSNTELSAIKSDSAAWQELVKLPLKSTPFKAS